MLNLSSSIRIFVCATPTDMRKALAAGDIDCGPPAASALPLTSYRTVIYRAILGRRFIFRRSAERDLPGDRSLGTLSRASRTGQWSHPTGNLFPAARLTWRAIALRDAGGFAFAADAFQQHRGRFVVGILRDQFATEGFGEDGLMEFGEFG